MNGKDRPGLYKGHIKDTSTEPFVSDFSRDPTNHQILFVHKKAEKLAMAVYMVTDLFPVLEPMRWELRRIALSFLSFIVRQPENRTISPMSMTENPYLCAIRVAEELTSSLEFAMRVHLFSLMNFSILKEEIISLSEELFRLKAGINFSENTVFPDQFFHVSPAEYENGLFSRVTSGVNREINRPPLANMKEKISKTGDKSPENDGNGNDESAEHKRHSWYDFKKGQNTDWHNGKINNEELKNKLILKKDQKVMRRETIASLLRVRGSLTIKDLATSISDCSEKTLQRELVSLIASGNVEKKGERRWSRYSLASR